jgi:PKD repeat protein
MKSILLPSLLLLSGGLVAQPAMDPAEGFTCRTHDPVEMDQWRLSDPEAWQHALELRDELERRAREGVIERERDTYIIPVVFHIIHDDGPENISNEQVQDAIRILNNDFNKLNTDWPNVRPAFLDLVADVGIEFKLAQYDPQGNCTNGITRTRSDYTYDGDNNMSGLIQWPRNRYMNIWVGASANGAAGYTNYPWVLNNQPQRDGIVVKHDYVGSIGTSSVGRSRVLTHEVGHWLNLPHCWGNSNEPGLEENCSMDDGVDDTPLTVGWTSCILSGSSCGSPLDNVENYMEYSYCAKMFTLGQGERMIAALTSTIAQRSSLWQDNNLIQTGVLNTPQLCAVEFIADDREICAGTSVTFVDASYSAVSARTWSFPGGEPATSSEATVTVTYPAAGTYPVELNVTDGVNALSVLEQSYITVLPDTGVAWPISEGFELVTGLNGPDWWVEDEEGNGSFALTSAAAYSGSSAVRLNNTSGTNGYVDALVSNVYDASGLASMTVGFRYAFARRQSWNEDVLRMYTSNNCGITWSPRKTLRAEDVLPTAPDQGGTFVPNGPGQWGYAEVSSFGPSNFVSNLRLKFEFTGGGGNFLYLDDININGEPLTTGLERVATADGLLMYPNPARTETRIRLDDTWRGPITVVVVDAMGRRVLDLGKMERSATEIRVPLTELSAGMHVVQVSTAGRTALMRLIVGGDGSGTPR